jgi:integrase
MFSASSERDLHAAIAAARTDESRGVGIDRDVAKITVRDYGDQRLASHTGAWQTRELIRNSLQRHWYPLIGDVPLVRLRPSRLQDAVAALAPRLSPLTIREQTVPHLRGVLRAAVADRIIPSDPSAGLRLPRVVRTEVRIPTPGEVEAVMTAIDPRYRALIAVGAGLGLRQGEAFGLSRDNVSLAGVKVDRQLKRNAVGVELGALKTNRSYRTVPLPQSVARELAAHRQRFPNDDPAKLLFVAPQGGRLRRDVWNRQALKPAVEAAGVPWLTFHGFRHFYASALIRANHAPAIVAARLGNTAQMVHETYSHLWPDDDDRTRQAIDDVFAREGLEPPAAGDG